MGKSKFNVVVKTIVVVVVIIIICTSISGYMVYKNIKDNTSKNNLIQSYFISINNKDFKNLNTLVNKSLRINDLDKIQYIKDNLVEIKVTSIEKIENTKEEYQVKYIREWSKEFI
ncbi:MAG: hypothetical protein RR645_05690, partial [Clostridium sp.]